MDTQFVNQISAIILICSAVVLVGALSLLLTMIFNLKRQVKHADYNLSKEIVQLKTLTADLAMSAHLPPTHIDFHDKRD